MDRPLRHAWQDRRCTRPGCEARRTRALRNAFYFVGQVAVGGRAPACPAREAEARAEILRDLAGGARALGWDGQGDPIAFVTGRMRAARGPAAIDVLRLLPESLVAVAVGTKGCLLRAEHLEARLRALTADDPVTAPADIVIRAVTLNQPLAWAVVHGGQPVVNRKWRPAAAELPAGALLALHAGQTFNEGLAQCLQRRGLATPPRDVPRGAIVGVAKFVEVVSDHPSPWFIGPFGWVLTEAAPIAPIPCRGALGVWDLPDALRALVLARYAAARRDHIEDPAQAGEGGPTR